MKFFDSIDLSELELKNFLVHNTPTSDVAKKNGRLVYSASTLYYSDTSKWYTVAKVDDINLNNLGIGSVTGGAGFLKRSSAGAWSFDTNTYLTQNQTITLSGDVSGSGRTSIDVTIGAGKVTNDMLAGSIANGKLANSSITIGSTTFSLGDTKTTLAGLTSVTSTSFVGELAGNASTATKLKTARNLWGNSFDGSAAVSGALTFTAVTTASTTAHLEVITVGGVTYLHTRLPFYSDSSVSAGGISDTPGGGGGLDEDAMWEALGGSSTNKVIAASHIPSLTSAKISDLADYAAFNSYYTKATIDDKLSKLLAEQDALVYRGVIAGGSTGNYGALTPAANKGDLYKVSTAGKINGISVEVGDMLICNTDSTAAATSSNYTTIAAKWDVIQTNLTNYVTTFGGQVGAITVRSGSTTRGDVNFSMSNKELQATVYLADWAKAANKPSYKTSEVTEETNLYFTTARAQTASKAIHPVIKTYTIASGSKTNTVAYDFKDANIVVSVYDASKNLVMADVQIKTSNSKYGVQVNFAENATEAYTIVAYGIQG